MLARMLKALDDRRPIRIDYAKPEGTTARTIEILDVRVSEAGSIYIRALHDGETKTFSVDRINRVRILRGRISFLSRSRCASADDVMSRVEEN